MQNTAEARQGSVTTWSIDPAHTTVSFTARHMMFTTVKGHFAGVSGEIVLDEEDVSGSRVQVVIDAATVDTRTEARDAHLRSADFLDVENHPELRFESRRITKRADGGLEVSGELTIRGVTREVTLMAEPDGQGTDPWGQRRIGFSGETRISRSEFGLVWNQALETGGVLVSDEVRIQLDVQAVAAQDG